MESNKINWAPLPGAQEEFLNLTEREALFVGEGASGKTECLIGGFLQHVGKGLGDNWCGIIFCSSKELLRDLTGVAANMFCFDFPDVVMTATESGGAWKFPEGESLRIAVINDAEKAEDLHDLDFQYVGFEELIDFSSSLYETLKSLAQEEESSIPIQIRATAPLSFGRDSWVYPYFNDANANRAWVHGRMSSNVFLTEKYAKARKQMEKLLLGKRMEDAIDKIYKQGVTK